MDASGGIAAPRRADLGFRRIDFVRLTVDHDGVRAQAAGIGHRLPREVPISLRSATRLIESGVPVVVHHTERSGESPLHGPLRTRHRSRRSRPWQEVPGADRQLDSHAHAS
jgi:hypothetical protein